MDTVTHAMLGAVVARSVGSSRLFGKTMSVSGHMAVSGCAAAFPDIDYLTFWIDPYRFLTEWHRGVTHSLFMLPLWSVLLGITFALICRRPAQWRSFSGWSALGLASHILGDAVTLFGTQVFAPLSDWRVALGLIFDVDPWISVILAVGLLTSKYRERAPFVARSSLFLVFAYLTTSAILKQNAATIIGQADLARQGFDDAVVHAVPQPLSPAHWKLIVQRPESYRVAYVDLFSVDWTGFAGPVRDYLSGFADYLSPTNLTWKTVYKFGNDEPHRELAASVWRHRRMEKFRRFAQFPSVYRIAGAEDPMCVWFTDLRYVFPVFGAPFRFGMCRESRNSDWRLYRLRRFSDYTKVRVD